MGIYGSCALEEKRVGGMGGMAGGVLCRTQTQQNVQHREREQRRTRN